MKHIIQLMHCLPILTACKINNPETNGGELVFEVILQPFFSDQVY